MKTAIYKHSRAKTYSFSGILLCTLFFFSSCLNTIRASEAPFERDYFPERKLTEEQERVVVQLAKKVGIKEIEKVTTRPRGHLAGSSIYVKEKEVKEKDTVTYRVLTMHHKAEREGEEEVIVMGDFWTTPDIREIKEAVVQVDGKEYRYPADSALSRAHAEKYFSLIVKGKYTVNLDSEDSDRSVVLEKIDLKKPRELTFREEEKVYHGQYGIKAQPKDYMEYLEDLTGYSLSFRLTNKGELEMINMESNPGS